MHISIPKYCKDLLWQLLDLSSFGNECWPNSNLNWVPTCTSCGGKKSTNFSKVAKACNYIWDISKVLRDGLGSQTITLWSRGLQQKSSIHTIYFIMEMKRNNHAIPSLPSMLSFTRRYQLCEDTWSCVHLPWIPCRELYFAPISLHYYCKILLPEMFTFLCVTILHSNISCCWSVCYVFFFLSFLPFCFSYISICRFLLLYGVRSITTAVWLIYWFYYSSATVHNETIYNQRN